MKKFLLGAVCALTVTSTSFAQMYGNDKGNGGDAVKINNELVMRDFVARSTLTPIGDSIAFVNSVPGLRDLISEIAQVNAALALRIVDDLSEVVLYTSNISLDVLPSSSTALNGVQAEVQLAVRWGNEIIFAPEFKSFNQKAYFMVHEALHGVLAGTGAMHHQRVRAIVKYLKDNRGHYSTEEIHALLLEAGSSDYQAGIPHVLFDSSVPMPLRCYAFLQSRSFLSRSMTDGSPVGKYFALDCGKTDPYLSGFVENYLATQMDLSRMVYDGKININLNVDTSVGWITNISLPKTGLFDRTEIYNQKDRCRYNELEVGWLVEKTQNLAPLKKFVKDMSAFLKRTDISDNTKIAVQYFLARKYASPVVSLNEISKQIQEVEKNIAEYKAVGLKNRKACTAKFGSSYKI